ncbi:MAG: hypothetical protein QXJ28_00400 [Candidatus Pacearchaeota archaeon]
MITYTDIYECLRKERYSESLQPLPKKFIQEFARYMDEKRKLASQNADIFSEEVIKSKKQMENSMSIFNELMLLRKKKILNLVFVASETGINKRDFENMTEIEKELFEKLTSAVKEADKAIDNQINSLDKKSGEELKTILFLEDVDELVSPTGEFLGPFKKDEITNLPKKIADILIESKKAEPVFEE